VSENEIAQQDLLTNPIVPCDDDTPYVRAKDIFAFYTMLYAFQAPMYQFLEDYEQESINRIYCRYKSRLWDKIMIEGLYVILCEYRHAASHCCRFSIDSHEQYCLWDGHRKELNKPDDPYDGLIDFCYFLFNAFRGSQLPTFSEFQRLFRPQETGANSPYMRGIPTDAFGNNVEFLPIITMGLRDVLTAVHDVFANESWSMSYGGQKWATITAQYIVCFDAGPDNVRETDIDLLLSLAHNTAAWITKFEYGGAIKKALDVKAWCKTPWAFRAYLPQDRQLHSALGVTTMGIKKAETISVRRRSIEEYNSSIMSVDAPPMPPEIVVGAESYSRIKNSHFVLGATTRLEVISIHDFLSSTTESRMRLINIFHKGFAILYKLRIAPYIRYDDKRDVYVVVFDVHRWCNICNDGFLDKDDKKAIAHHKRLMRCDALLREEPKLHIPHSVRKIEIDLHGMENDDDVGVALYNMFAQPAFKEAIFTDQNNIVHKCIAEFYGSTRAEIHDITKKPNNYQAELVTSIGTVTPQINDWGSDLLAYLFSL